MTGWNPLVKVLIGTTMIGFGAFSLPCRAEALQGQAFSFGLPSLSYTRQQTFSTTTGSTSIGLAAEYSIFLTQKFAVMGQFVTNMDSSSIVFLGGGAGIKYYLLGGANMGYEDPYFHVLATPKMHAFGILGLVARSFDFTALDKKLEATQKGPKLVDPKGTAKGFFLGPLFGFGAEAPVFGITVGFRAQVFSSFASETSPGISGTEIWLYSTWVL